MTHKTNSDFFIRSACTETAPLNHEKHPSEDELLALLSGDLEKEQRSRLHAHLATCSSCRTRSKTMEMHLSEETVSLQERSTGPSFVATIRKNRAVSTQSRPWWRSLFGTWMLSESGSMVVAGSAAVIVLAFVVMIPVFQNSLQQARSTIETLTIKNNRLELQLNSTSVPPISNNMPEQINMEEILLAYDWTTLRPYEVEAAADWRFIAGKELGSVNLWPMLWLLNAERAMGEALNPGETIWLPTQRE